MRRSDATVHRPLWPLKHQRIGGAGFERPLAAYQQALGVVRPGETISRVGVPQYDDAPTGFGALFGRNLTLIGGPAPVRAYIERLLPAILDGTVDRARCSIAR